MLLRTKRILDFSWFIVWVFALSSACAPKKDLRDGTSDVSVTWPPKKYSEEEIDRMPCQFKVKEKDVYFVFVHVGDSLHEADIQKAKPAAYLFPKSITDDLVTSKDIYFSTCEKKVPNEDAIFFTRWLENPFQI